MNKLIFCMLFGALALLLPRPAGAQVVVIANSSVKVAAVSKADLHDLFTGASSNLASGTHVTPVLLRDSAIHEEFLSLYVGKSDTAFRTSWRNLIFSGQGVMPRSLDSEAAVVVFVARTPGAIGYISRATPHDGVKTLAVR